MLRTGEIYTYDRLIEDITYLGYNGADTGSIGKSVLGLGIPYVHFGGYRDKQLIITGGIHARENLTCLLVMRQAFGLWCGRELPPCGIYFVPMLNPDGALLIEKGAAAAGDRAAELLKINGGADFSLWKANINGVDLNNNFDAYFGKGEGQVDAPSSHGYPGKKPFDQPETAALRDFTLAIKPAATVSYHALGREVYWSFFQPAATRVRDRAIAKRIARHLDYTLVDSDMGSTGGYKDWCVQKLVIPALTIEIVSPCRSHPLPLSALDEDWEVNRRIPMILGGII